MIKRRWLRMLLIRVPAIVFGLWLGYSAAGWVGAGAAHASADPSAGGNHQHRGVQLPDGLIPESAQVAGQVTATSVQVGLGLIAVVVVVGWLMRYAGLSDPGTEATALDQAETHHADAHDTSHAHAHH